MKSKAYNIDNQEIEKLQIWLATAPIPDDMRDIISKLILLPDFLIETAGDKAALLKLIKKLMGIVPSSEKGSVGPKQTREIYPV